MELESTPSEYMTLHSQIGIVVRVCPDSFKVCTRTRQQQSSSYIYIILITHAPAITVVET